MTTIITSEEDILDLNIGQRAIVHGYCEEVTDEGITIQFDDWSTTLVKFSDEGFDISNDAKALLDEPIELMTTMTDDDLITTSKAIDAAIKRLKSAGPTITFEGHVYQI